MKIFITGGTGFIGQHLVKKLAQTEHELVCLCRKTSNCESIQDCDARLVVGDVVHKITYIEAMDGCQAVINLANQYSFWEPDPGVYSTINIEGTRNLMEAALKTGVEKVIHVSTALTYGKPDDYPFNEDSPVGPEHFSEYARTKYEGDLIAWEMHEKQGLPPE